MLWEKGRWGEMLQFLYNYKLWSNCPPPHRLTIMHYDYDIAVSSGGNGSPVLDFAQGVVDPRDGHC